MRRMLKHKGFSVFLTTFAVVLLSGIALAQVGMMSAAVDEGSGQAPSLVAPASAGFVGDGIADEPTEPKPKEPVADEPVREEPVDKEPAHEEPAHEEPVDKEPAHEEPTDKEPAHDGPTDKEPAHEEGVDDSVLLEITSPRDGAHVEREVITFKGVSDPDAVVTYGRYEARMDDAGHWAITLVLHQAGENVMPFRAEDAAGNVAEASVTVYLDVVEEKPKFSAQQKWDASDDDPPMNHYWGTATPGTGIVVMSEYGSSHTEANADGAWETTVVFEGAPHAEKFKVVVESGDGGRAEFWMKVFYPTHEDPAKFTANQKYGSCGEDIPYDVFWGTATPGAEIWVESEYGGGATTANESGHWELRVDFPEAPVGDVFGVIVRSSDGGIADFTFVATA